MLHRHLKSSETDSSHPESHTNYRFLGTPEKHERLQRLRQKARVLELHCKRTKERLERAIEERGTQVDADLHGDLSNIMIENSPTVTETYPPDSFAHIFWEQQHKASLMKDSRSMKWEPMMIRWCLYLRHLSSSAYETLRSSGVLKLPSQRTLRDYTHYTQASCGFSSKVDKQIMDIASIQTCPEREKYVVILMDEMHIRENLVYDKHTGIRTIIAKHVCM